VCQSASQNRVGCVSVSITKQSAMCVSQHHKTEWDVCQSASQNRLGCVSVGRLCQTMAAAWLNACLAVSLAVVAVA